MIRQIINLTTQNKNFIMFITAFIYIIGIFVYFTNYAVFICTVLSVLAVISILKNYISPKLVIFWTFIFYFGFINCTIQIKNSDKLCNIAPQREIILEGQVLSIPNSNFRDRTRFFFKTNEGKTLATIYSKNENFSDIKIGNYYKIKGILKIPSEAVNPSQFDYGGYLKNFNTYTVFYADLKNVQNLDKPLELKWKIFQSLNDTRNEILKTHKKYLKSPNAEILGGIVFGDDAIAPPDEIKNAFINSGLLHILAASGMNVAFIYGFWFFFLRKIFKFPFNLTVISGMFVVVLYAFMTGLGASVVRATIMLLFILAGKLINRDTHSIALLSLVAMLMLIYNPAYINDVSFQLSFLVTFGLLLSASFLANNDTSFKGRFVGMLKDAVLIPFIAQIWVAPLQMFYFNTFSPYSIFANISVVIFLPFISFCGFVSSILALIKPIADTVCKVFDFVLNPFITELVNISEYFSKLPHSQIITTHPSSFQVILYYTTILLIILLLKKYSRGILYIVIFCISLIVLSTIHIPNKNLEIISFAVQNADAFLIKSPKNKYFVIDTAKSGYKNGKSQAEMIILKYMKDNGIKNIEGMIITHFDNDHSGGAVDIFKYAKVKNTYINSYNNDSKTSKEIYKTIKPLTLAKNNTLIYKEPNFEIRLFLVENPPSDNEGSIITEIHYNNFTMLFMGDAGIFAYNKLKQNLSKNITILKVGHHGAKGVIDADMIKDLNPDYSIISSAPNDYKHPHALTLNTLRKHNVLRTDINNSIKIIFNKESYKIYTFNKELKKYLKYTK